MASVVWHYPRTGIWRFSRRDSTLVALAVLHTAILVVWPMAPLIALGVWWNSNTIAHNFIHRPFFRSARANRVFSAALSVLLGIPQTLWRDRHLAHHAGVEWRLHISRRLAIETGLVLCLWTALASLEARFFLVVYLPGYLAGLGLCAMQGHWEHSAGRATSHYGRIYNFLCFNDGYHAEHHAAPAIHWTKLPEIRNPAAATSQWPPLMRWLDMRPPVPSHFDSACGGGCQPAAGCEPASPTHGSAGKQPARSLTSCPTRHSRSRRESLLEALECLVLRSSWLQRFVLRTHRRAFETLLPQLHGIRRVTIVGGGLFPRTALILRELLPAAHLTIVDSDAENLETARGFLGGSVEYRNERYVPGESRDCDLTVIPLCLDGDREAIYRGPPSPAVLVHDWIWRRSGTGAVVSAAPLKRLNLVSCRGAGWQPAAGCEPARSNNVSAGKQPARSLTSCPTRHSRNRRDSLLARQIGCERGSARGSQPT
jgi:hypothetical protein